MEKISTDVKILDAAITVFSRLGYSAASTKEIAKEAGVAEGTIFRYFKTKKNILYKILDNLVKLLADNSTIRPVEKIINDIGEDCETAVLTQLLFDRIKFIKENSAVVKIIMTEALYNDDISRLFYYSVITKMIPEMLDFMDKGARNGTFVKMNKDEETAVIRNFIAISAAFLYQRTYVPNFALIDEERDIALTVDSFLNGIKAANL